MNNKRRIFWLSLGIVVGIMAHRIASTDRIVSPGSVAYIDGDTPTVWNMAAKQFPQRDPREVVNEIRILNPGIQFGSVRDGDPVVLPKAGK